MLPTYTTIGVKPIPMDFSQDLVRRGRGVGSREVMIDLAGADNFETLTSSYAISSITRWTRFTYPSVRGIESRRFVTAFDSLTLAISQGQLRESDSIQSNRSQSVVDMQDSVL